MALTSPTAPKVLSESRMREIRTSGLSEGCM